MDNVWKLRLLYFFQSLIPAYVIERLFWEQRGITVQQVVYTEILYALTILLLEIPTGVLADRWNRKKMLVVSALLGCFEFLLLIYATEFWHFAVVVILAGISFSFQSGSGNALLYESLKDTGQEQQFEKELGILEVWQLIGAIVAACCGSLLAESYPLVINYWLSLISVLLALSISCLLIEPTCKQTVSLPPSVWVYTRAAIRFFWKKPHVFIIISAGMIVGASLNFIEEFWQLYLSELKIPIGYFGLFSTCCMLFQIPGNLVVPILKKYYHSTSILIFIQIIFVFGYCYISLVPHLTNLLMIFILFFVSSMVVPLVTGYLHHQVQSDIRATIDSFQSLGTNLAVMGMGLGFGYFTSYSNIFGGFGFIACLSLVYLLIFIVYAPKN